MNNYGRILVGVAALIVAGTLLGLWVWV